MWQVEHEMHSRTQELVKAARACPPAKSVPIEQHLQSVNIFFLAAT